MSNHAGEPYTATVMVDGVEQEISSGEDGLLVLPQGTVSAVIIHDEFDDYPMTPQAIRRNQARNHGN